MKKQLLLACSGLLALASTASATDYKLVTSLADLELDKEYVMAYSANPTAADATCTANGTWYSTNKYITAVTSVSCANGVITLEDGSDVKPITLKAGSAANTYAIMLDGVYVSITGTGNNSLAQATEIAETCDLTFDSMDDNYQIKMMVVKNSNSNQNLFQCNAASGNERFSNYKTGTQKNIQLFKKDEAVTPPPAVEVAAPEITMAEDSNMVTITTTETDGKIYYTLDGTAPTAESTEYTAPFELTQKGTVKAITVVGENSSAVTSKQLYLNVVTSLAAFMENASPNPCLINCPIVAIYHNGKYTMVTDIYTYAMIYDESITEAPNGTKWADVKATYSYYSGGKYGQLTSVVLGTASEVRAIEPTVVAINAIADQALFSYVKLEEVEIADINNNKSFNVKSGEDTYAGYNNFGISLPEAGTYTITGFVGQYGTNSQIWPVDFSKGGQEVVVVKDPVFDPASGYVDKDAVVKITCATEGASIYYNIDSEEDPTPNSTLYTEEGITISKIGTTTIKAIAVKENCQDSKVVTAEYTVTDPASEEIIAMIVFAEQGWQTGAGNVYGPNQKEVTWKSRNGYEFRTIAETAGQNYPAFYETDPKGLRVYGSAANDNTITVIAPAGYYMLSVETDNDARFAATEVPADDSDNQEPAKATAEDDGVTPANTPCEFPEKTLAFTLKTAEQKTTGYTFMNIGLEQISSAVENIEMESAAPVFYNLQGMRVNNPTNGLYIRVEGNKSTKVLVK